MPWSSWDEIHRCAPASSLRIGPRSFAPKAACRASNSSFAARISGIVPSKRAGRKRRVPPDPDNRLVAMIPFDHPRPPRRVRLQDLGMVLWVLVMWVCMSDSPLNPAPAPPARDRRHRFPAPLRLGVVQGPLWKPWYAHARRDGRLRRRFAFAGGALAEPGPRRFDRGIPEGTLRFPAFRPRRRRI